MFCLREGYKGLLSQWENLTVGIENFVYQNTFMPLRIFLKKWQSPIKFENTFKI